MQSNVIDFKAYKRAKGIALPRSPYYTLAATDEQIREAYHQAAQALNSDSRVTVQLSPEQCQKRLPKNQKEI